jgi:hypothetical protein
MPVAECLRPVAEYRLIRVRRGRHRFDAIRQ